MTFYLLKHILNFNDLQEKFIKQITEVNILFKLGIGNFNIISYK